MKTTIGVAVAAFAAMALVAAPVAAQQYGGETGTLSVSDTTLSPGDPVVVEGSGFAPDTRVEVTMESTPQVLDTVEADDSGSVSAQVVIPADASAGSHTLKATGVTPDGATLVLSATVSIVAAGSEVAGTGDDLAGTGSRVGVVVVAAAALLILGISGVAASRRRSRA